MPKRIIEDFTGAKKEMDCIGCAITEAGKDQPGYIIETRLFHAHQDYEIPIIGFVVLSTKRHIISFDEFTDEEAAEFIGLVREIRRAQRQVLGIETVYFIQEENNIGSHFHLWFLPRYEWMNDEAKFGKKLNSARPVLQFSKTHMKTPKNIAAVKEAAEKLRVYLNK
ncbi:MAG: hypothetical protein A3J06_04250 [Candidatus Moranbacteria bacterium RIFCSPLOWO2_02_FULL_48_19]|nr:MAG: hypothetical protein A3J06_04250 [Candidatus Moranbacteria bacterium RIFCSPLOWO2_02_FULL_48_19]OGI31481.1 MAG: hypothetical protein A3G09_03750 [Candidatus Moranbacteria bacterium RIFCSPLOWO2_12_FULL_48_12]